MKLVRANRHTLLATGITVFAMIFASGCVTGGKKTTRRTKPTTEVTKKPGTKEKAPAGQPAPQVTAKPEVPPPPSVEQQLKFFKTHVIPESAFGEEDIYFLSTVPSAPDAASVSEAVITIGILRTIINPVGSVIKPTFSEEDLGGSGDQKEPETARSGPSVEKLFKEKNVDLADALAENPLLATHAVASMVRQALSLGSDDPDYQAEIVNIIKKTAQKWADLNRSLGGEAPAPDPETPVEPKLMTDAYGNVYDANAPKKGDESTIADAQRLADAGRFQDAIKLASSVGTGHPSYPLAQEKIKDYSNKAVQNLRKKAAAAFQSAMPITDAKIRAQYLRQAKTFLEEAIKNYPQATQLPTVRDNLRIISRDLEKLESEAGG